MKNIIQYFREVSYLLENDVRKLPLMAGLFLSVSTLDLAGIGLIAPYVGLIVSPDSFANGKLHAILSSLGMPTDANEVVSILGIVLVTIFLFKAVSAILINKVIITFCFNRSVELRSSLMTSYQGLPYIEYLKRNSSEYIHNINLADKFAGSSLQSLLRLVSEGLVAIAIIVLLAFSDIVALAILTLLLGSMVIIYDRIFRPNIARYGEQSNQYSTQIVQGIHEGIEGLKEVRILGKQSYFHKMMRDGAQGYSDVNVKASMISTAPRYLLDLIMVTFVVLLILSANFSGQSLEELLPILSMFGIAGMRLAPAANQMINGITRLRFGRAGVRLLYSDLCQLESQESVLLPPAEETLEIVASDETKNNIEIKQNTFNLLRIENVEFTYPNIAKPAVQDVSLEIRQGDVIGLMGTSGAGKTTLIDIILGLLEPQKGCITYNGKRLSREVLSEWRSQVAYLPQQVFLIDNTLRQNIALGLQSDEIDDEKVYQALNHAQLKELLDNLPDGINTMLGERGIRISGGQKQRVALARAFYHGKSVLIMDESTSALDSETENEIVTEINRLKGTKTMFVIAHRLSTLRHCNRILRIENGRLFDQGDYAQVCSKKVINV